MCRALQFERCFTIRRYRFAIHTCVGYQHLSECASAHPLHTRGSNDMPDFSFIAEAFTALASIFEGLGFFQGLS